MRQKLTRSLTLGAAVLVAAYGANVLATSQFGFSGTTIAVGRFGDIDVAVPNGSTGWHSPGHSLIIVTAGTVTAYEGDGTSCTVTEYTAGMGFVDAGGDHPMEA